MNWFLHIRVSPYIVIKISLVKIHIVMFNYVSVVISFNFLFLYLGKCAKVINTQQLITPKKPQSQITLGNSI